MEHDHIDKMFRKILEEEQVTYSESSIKSKEIIWNKLDFNGKRSKSFPFWKVAAGIFFISFLWSINLLKQESYSQIQELLYFQRKNDSLTDINRVLQGKITALLVNKKSKSTYTKSPKVNNAQPVKIYFRDTVYLERDPIMKEVFIYHLDTVYLPPVKTTHMDNSELVNITPKSEPVLVNRDHKPSSVQFLFESPALKYKDGKVNFVVIPFNDPPPDNSETNPSGLLLSLRKK